MCITDWYGGSACKGACHQAGDLSLISRILLIENSQLVFYPPHKCSGTRVHTCIPYCINVRNSHHGKNRADTFRIILLCHRNGHTGDMEVKLGLWMDAVEVGEGKG